MECKSTVVDGGALFLMADYMKGGMIKIFLSLSAFGLACMWSTRRREQRVFDHVNIALTSRTLVQFDGLIVRYTHAIKDAVWTLYRMCTTFFVARWLKKLVKLSGIYLGSPGNDGCLPCQRPPLASSSVSNSLRMSRHVPSRCLL